MTIFTFYDEAGHVITAHTAPDDAFPYALAHTLRKTRIQVYVTAQVLTPLHEVESAYA